MSDNEHKLIKKESAARADLRRRTKERELQIEREKLLAEPSEANSIRLHRIESEIARMAYRAKTEPDQRILTEAVMLYRSQAGCPAQWCRAFCTEHSWFHMHDGETKAQFMERVRRAGAALDARAHRRRHSMHKECGI
jgi:hypothetical protein